MDTATNNGTGTNRIEGQTAPKKPKKSQSKFKRLLSKLEKIGEKKAAQYKVTTEEGTVTASTKGRVCLSVGEVAKQAGKEGASVSTKGADGVSNKAVITGEDAEDFILDDMAEEEGADDGEGEE